MTMSAPVDGIQFGVETAPSGNLADASSPKLAPPSWPAILLIFGGALTLGWTGVLIFGVSRLASAIAKQIF